jgi:glycosyltransferase involved in cell wall biosynthesis
MRKVVAQANPVGAGTLRLTAIPAWAPTALHRVCAQRVLRRFQPDIVHTHLNPAARRIGRIAQRRGIPHVATLHLSYEQREVGNCDGLICIAEWQRATLGGFAGEVAVVHNWLPHSLEDAIIHTKQEQVQSLRQAWSADHATFVFGSVGRLVAEKDMPRLVRVFRAAFPNGDEPVRLAIVGDGPQRAELEALAVQDPRIFIAGAQENVAPYYLAFDAFVSTANFEPFGLSILEAMAAGCPLVLTRTQGPSEFVTDKRALWAEAGDDDALVAHLVATANAGWQRPNYDLKHFSQARAAAEIETLYRHVIALRGEKERLA